MSLPEGQDILGIVQEQAKRIAKLEEVVSFLLMKDSSWSAVDEFLPEGNVVDVSNTLSLAFAHPFVEQKWYVKRSFSDIFLRVVDARGNLFTDTANMFIAVRVVSGHSYYVDHIIQSKKVPIIEGCATISGVRLFSVSSRFGGTFQLEFNVVENPQIVNVRTPSIVVLSERLRADAKVASILELQPSDSLSRAPGIGKKYAERMAEIGVKTVQDLAAVDETKRKEIIEIVRKARGQLTDARLAALCAGAKTVVSGGPVPPNLYPSAEELAAAEEEEDDDCTCGMSRREDESLVEMAPPPKKVKYELLVPVDEDSRNNVNDIDAMLDLTRTEVDMAYPHAASIISDDFDNYYRD